MRCPACVLLLMLVVGSMVAAQPVWQQVTSLPGGRAQYLVQSPSGSVFVSSLRSAYRSTDDGHSWRPVSGNLDTIKAGMIVPTLDGTLLMRQFTLGVTSLYRSTDEGRVWQAVDPDISGGFVVSAIAVNASTRTVYVSAGNNIIRSTDNGVTWDTAVAGSGGVLLFSVDDDLYRMLGNRIQRLDGERDFAPSTVPLPSLPGSSMFHSFTMRGREILMTASVDSVLRLYRTADSGRTWTWLDSGASVGRVSVTRDGAIFGLGNRITRSTDGGDTWTELRAYDSSVTVSAIIRTQLGSLIAQSNIGIDRSDDNGATWKSSDAGFFAHTIEGITADTRGNVFTLIRGGVFNTHELMNSASTDGGATWRVEKANPPQHQDRHPLQFDDDGTLYQAGNQGLFASSDLGVTWTLHGPLDGQSHWRLATKGDTLVATNWYHTPFYSIDHGASWHRLPKPTEGYDYFSAIAFAPDGALLFSRDSSHWRTTDLGVTWERTQLDVNSGTFYDGDNGYVYMISTEGLFRSPNGANDWQYVHALRGVSLYALATSGRHHLMRLTDSLVLSVDDGATWQPANEGIGPHPVTWIVADARGRFYAGTAGGGLFMLDVVSGVVDVASRRATPRSLAVTVESHRDEAIVRYDCTGEARISLIDARGSIVHVDAGVDGVARLSTGLLSAGVYFVQVRCGGLVGYAGLTTPPPAPPR